MSDRGFEGSPIAFGYAIERDVRVPMRDGAYLAADVYHPVSRGKPVDDALPVLLERTPYDKNRLSHSVTGRYFAKRGYVTVMQDVRGRGGSQGDFGGLAAEAEDGYDTFAWLGRQRWCNGKIGTIGFSYTTGASQALAVLNPPHLATQTLYDGGFNYHTHGFRSAGACEYGKALQYAVFMACTSQEAAHDRQVKDALERMRAEFNAWVRRAPLRRGESPLRLVPHYENWFFDVLTRAEYDEYWKNPGWSIEDYLDTYPDVPIMLETSWYGSHVWAALKKYEEFGKRHRSEMQLLIGTWVHGPDNFVQSWAGDADFGPEAALESVNDVRLRWFDRQLKGMKTGIEEEAPIRIFVMGGGSGRRNALGRLDHGGKWRDEHAWPLPGSRPTPYYLHPGGKLSIERAPANGGSSSYAFNPNDPVPTIGGNNFNLGTAGFLEGGGFDQRGRPELAYCTDRFPLANRRDVLVFRTEPLESGVELTGALSVRLWISSSAVDTDFTAKLIDEYPPNDDYPEGYALNIADAIVRVRYRNSREKAELMTPGQIYEIVLEPQATSNYFSAGHRIRLDISSSNAPRYDVNPNTGEPPGLERRFAIANQTVYHNREQPSHIVLPVVS